MAWGNLKNPLVCVWEQISWLTTADESETVVSDLLAVVMPANDSRRVRSIAATSDQFATVSDALAVLFDPMAIVIDPVAPARASRMRAV